MRFWPRKSEIELAEAKILNLGPNDRLVLFAPEKLSKHDCACLREQATAAFSLAADRVVILDRGVDVGVLRWVSADPFTPGELRTLREDLLKSADRSARRIRGKEGL